MFPTLGTYHQISCNALSHPASHFHQFFPREDGGTAEIDGMTLTLHIYFSCCHTNTFYRSKPVVRVKSKLSFSSALNKQVNLEEKGCTLRDLTPVTCLPLSLCMEYDGEGADDVIGKDTISKLMFMQSIYTLNGYLNTNLVCHFNLMCPTSSLF